jgi:hypothetical protein
MSIDLHRFNDRQLIELCLNDSEEAMEDFYRRFHAQIAECIAKSFRSHPFGCVYSMDRQDAIDELVQRMYVFLLEDERKILRLLSNSTDVPTALQRLTKKFVLDSLRDPRTRRTAISFESREPAKKATDFTSSPVQAQSSWLPHQAC